jgi:hypothetical protein
VTVSNWTVVVAIPVCHWTTVVTVPVCKKKFDVCGVPCYTYITVGEIRIVDAD